MSLVFILSVLMTNYIFCLVGGQLSCRTPSGGGGVCIDVDQCPPLVTILNKPRKTNADYDLLRQSQCGFNGNMPKVCCPQITPPPKTFNIRCFTPDGKEGRCISVHSCPQLSRWLQQPPSTAIITFIRNSRCNGPQPQSVCCAQSTAVVPTVTTPEVCPATAYPPDPRTECCGIDGESSKIYGGSESGIDQYPWLVIIEYKKGNQIKLLCGGALISGRYVLTAGHCVAGQVLDSGTPVNVRLGEYDITNSGPDCVEAAGGGRDCTPGALILPIERTIPHPQYNPSHQLRRNDIALIRLREMAPYTDFIRPICLPSTDMTARPAINSRLETAGWGAVDMQTSSSNTKLFVDLPLVSANECNAVYNNRFNIPLWKGQLCAGGEKGKDSCKGDSGGPLMYQNGRTYEVVGIVSFGPTPCGQENIPGVYTKVYEYLPWIRSQIKP